MYVVAKKTLRRKNRHHDQRLSKREFREFIYKVAEHMPGEEAFDMFVDFLVSSVEVSNTICVSYEQLGLWFMWVLSSIYHGSYWMS